MHALKFKSLLAAFPVAVMASGNDFQFSAKIGDTQHVTALHCKTILLTPLEPQSRFGYKLLDV